MRQRPGRALEITWFLVAFVPIVNGIAFWIAGQSAGVRKWILWGVGMLSMIIPLAIIDSLYATDKALDESVVWNVAMGIEVGLWMLGIGLAFWLRPKWRLAYEQRHAAQQSAAPPSWGPQTQQTPARAFHPPPQNRPMSPSHPPQGQPVIPSQPPQSQPVIPTPEPPAAASAPTPVPSQQRAVDANSATAQMLVGAGVPQELAARIVAARRSGAFASMEELVGRAEAKPHEVAHCYHALSVAPASASPGQGSGRGRVVDA